MIKLDIPDEPYWLDLVDGVRVLVRPCTTALVSAAKKRAEEKLAFLEASLADLSDFGGDVTLPADQLSNETLGQIEIAQAAIMDWSGIGMDAEMPRPFNAAGLDDFCNHPVLLGTFINAYLKPYFRMVAAGKP